MSYFIGVVAIAGIGYLIYRGIKSNKLTGIIGLGSRPNNGAEGDIKKN